MTSPTVYRLPADSREVQIGDTVKLVDGAHIQPLTLTVACIFEDRHRTRSQWWHGHDPQGRLHAVRVELPE